ncbi:hypothetical protein CDD83_9108 [Cordyceps sp. RAO-2017]|nr:hypothetical protein CDD83_9108 [Cordyceps sp. RAO-2017]
MRDLHRRLERDFGGRLAVAGGAYADIGVMGALRAGYDAARPGCGRATGLERFAHPDPYDFVPIAEVAQVRSSKAKKAA